jgi:hypothetical protein
MEIFPRTIEVHVGRMILKSIIMAVSQVPETEECMNILGFYKSVPERRGINICGYGPVHP